MMPKKPKPKPKPKPQPLAHEKLLRQLITAFERETKAHDTRLRHTDRQVYAIIHRLEHLTALVEAIGENQGNPDKIRAIIAQIAQNKLQLTQALEAEPPASPESGEPPQG
jgi:hypothetical protein